MKARWIAVIFLWVWVCGMFAAVFGTRAYERYWGEADTSHSVIVPITVKAVSIPKPPEPVTVMEKTQERVESPPIRTASAEESPPPAAVTLPTPAPPAKAKRRKIVKKAPAPASLLVGGQPL